jgi:hypothetical protein
MLALLEWDVVEIAEPFQVVSAHAAVSGFDARHLGLLPTEFDGDCFAGHPLLTCAALRVRQAFARQLRCGLHEFPQQKFAFT